MAGGHDAGGGLRWLLTYADLITLLLALFILLYSTAKQDVEKFKLMSVAFKKAFNVPVMEGKDTSAVSGVGGQTAPIQLDNMNFVSEKMARYVEGEGFADVVTVGRTEEGLMISLSGSQFFDPASADLTTEGRDVLDRIGVLINQLPNNVRIEGHTDNIPINTRAFPSNWELSGSRALTALRYLAEIEEVPYERLSYAGYGEYRPIADNHTREGRSRNRRVDIIVLNQLPATPRSGTTPGPPSVLSPPLSLDTKSPSMRVP